MMIDKVIKVLSECSPVRIVFIFTTSVLLGSVPMVYFFTLLFNEPYTPFLLELSIVLPIILTPPTIIVLLRISKYLKHFKEELQKEIQKK